MYKRVTFLAIVLLCLTHSMEKKQNEWRHFSQHFFFFNVRVGKPQSHERGTITREKTGMEVKGKLDKLLALDGTERTEKTHTKYSKNSTQLTMVNNNGTQSQKATGARSFSSSHSSQASRSLQPQELFCAAMSQKRCLKTLELCNGHTSYW